VTRPALALLVLGRACLQTAVLATVVCTTTAGGQVSPVAGSPAATVMEWRRAMNTRSLTSMVRFRERFGPADEAPYAAGEDFSVADRAVVLDSVRYLRTDAAAAELLVRLRAVHEYRVLVAQRTPDGVTTLAMRSPDRKELREVPVATARTLLPRMRAQVSRAIRNDRFSGTLLVAHEGQVVLAQTAGFAHLGHRVPNRRQTRFNIASVGKMFTGVAIARLIADGRLSLETRVGAVLPEFANAVVRDSVTIRMLLAHRAGIPNLPPTPDRAFLPSDSLLAQIERLPLDFAPDSMTSYSNSGFLLLGRIIERLTGRPYWAHLDSAIFRPLAMRKTGPCDPREDTPELAQGYTYDRLDGPLREILRNNTSMLALSSAAGGACSTADDLLRFMQALATGRLVPAGLLAIMTRPSGAMQNVGGRPYGLAFEPILVGGERGYGHSGGHPGVTAYAAHFPRTGYTVIAMSNRDREASRLAGMLAMLIGDTAPVP
jgi:D-alanyl-D-alanine carboxypeptidase